MRSRLALVVMLTAACAHDEAGSTPLADRRVLAPMVPSGDEIVAEVGGVPILASAVAAQAKSAGVDARAALTTLIDAEVLAEAALARGLLDDPDVREATRSAEVRRLLATDFQRDTPDTKIPDADYRKLYALNKLRFEHADAREVWHLLVPAPEATSTPAQRAEARGRLLALVPAAKTAPTDEAFAALAAAGPRDPPAARMKAEHITFPRKDVVEEPFAAAAFALSRPGVVSEIVETSYGYHLIRLVQIIPGRHLDLDAARPELHDAASSAYRTQAFERWARELVDRAHVELHVERLAEPVLVKAPAP